MTQSEPIEMSVKTRGKPHSLWTERIYFVATENNEIVANDMINEKECVGWITVAGDLDVEYFVGYSTQRIIPKIKTAKIVLK